MNRQQLEISLAVRPCLRPAHRRQRRQARALWWFSQMRRAVNEAVQWKPASAERAEQPLLPLVRAR